ncbi:MAG: esterase/lipase family protein, partial [Candidatus Binatia bacterium]
MDPKGDTAGWLAGGLRTFGAEMAALASVVGALPWRSLAEDTLGERDSHPVPVVLVHGIFGHPTNFASLRRHLARRGIRRFSSFGYRPRLDYQRLALDLHQHVPAVCRQTGTPQVD